MTGDELAAAIYREQGYLVFASTCPLKIGEISREQCFRTSLSLAEIPLRVIGPASLAEFAAQYERSRTRAPAIPKMRPARYIGWYFYRVEAAD